MPEHRFWVVEHRYHLGLVGGHHLWVARLGCSNIISGAAAPSSSGLPGGRHILRMGSHQLDGKIYPIAVPHIFLVRRGNL